MSTESAVAIVIPSWNSAALLPRCLDSLSGQEEHELIVVDNGSSDGTLELLRERGIAHLTLGTNLGFAVAVNRGVAATSAPFVLPLNADTELEPGAVAALRAALERDAGLGGAAPRILQVEGAGRDVAAARLYSAGQGLTRDGRGFEIGAGEAQTPAGGTGAGAAGREVFGVCGAACLLRRELFTDLGGYDESFFSFYEDVELNVRARIAGWRFEYVPEAVVWHVGNASWLAEVPSPSAWNARLVARNRLVTQARFMPASALPRIAAVEAGALARAASERRLRATLRGKLEGLSRLPAALRERRHLAASGDLSLPRTWLGRTG
jgi:GT2 family glycosyltransferase